jgi:hypothetical protein
MDSDRDKLVVMPYTLLDDEWSLTDRHMTEIWLQMEREDNIKYAFFDGSVRSLEEWLSFVKQPDVFVAVVIDVERNIPVHVVWLSNASGPTAWAHHCVLGKYRRGAWEAVRAYWKNSVLRIIFGCTPETNKMAIKFLTKIGRFTVAGTLPELCYLAYENKRVGGTLSYCYLKT